MSRKNRKKMPGPTLAALKTINPPAKADPAGWYTGKPAQPRTDRPEQDADDL